MLEFRGCLPEHVRSLKVQPEQRAGFNYMLGSGLDEDVLKGMSFSAFLDGACVAAGGVFTQWGQHGIGWLMASTDVGPHMMQLTHFTRGLFEMSPYRRISITVACDFEKAHRWAKLLGMTMESERMVAYDPFGRDAALYAWIRKSVDG